MGSTVRRIIDFLDEVGDFAAAVLGVVSLMSMPITYGDPQFQLSTYGAVISVVILFLVSVARLLAWMYQQVTKQVANR